MINWSAFWRVFIVVVTLGIIGLFIFVSEMFMNLVDWYGGGADRLTYYGIASIFIFGGLMFARYLYRLAGQIGK